MDLLQWQQTDKNQFAVFIRDLSINLNNVKHMIEDTTKQVGKHNKHDKHKKGKKVVKKKKDIIIEQQNKIRYEKNIKEDLSKLDYILENLKNDNPYPSFSLMKTEKGLLELKCRMLDHFWKLKKEYFPHVINLYFQLVDKEVSEDYKKLLETIQSKLATPFKIEASSSSAFRSRGVKRTDEIVGKKSLETLVQIKRGPRRQDCFHGVVIRNMERRSRAMCLTLHSFIHNFCSNWG